MSEPRRHPLHYSVEEYLSIDEASQGRLEYVDGVIYAMTGAHTRHNRIAMNIAARLWMAARGGPCRIYMSDVKVRVAPTRFYYPDVVSVCAPRSDDGKVVSDPCLIVEVTSPSTARADWNDKREAYLAAPSLRTYLIVDQRQRLVDQWWREPGGEWQSESVAEQGEVPLPCPAMKLTLDDIYEGVLLPPRPRHRRVYEAPPEYEPAGDHA